MAWPREQVEYARRTFQSRKFDENDVSHLHHTRIISDCADLTVKRRNRLQATREAIALCIDGQAGTLFRKLFVAFFRRFNINYLSGCPETPLVQDTIPVILWRLSVKAGDWVAAGELPPEVFHPIVRAQICKADPWESAETSVLVFRVLEPLMWFGLLEANPPKFDFTIRIEDHKFRKTPLFDQFLSFVFTR